MSSLTVYHQSNPDVPNKVLTHLEDIAATLAEVGVRFERWQASAPIQPGAAQDEVIAAYYQGLTSVRERGYYDDTRLYVRQVRATMARLSGS